MIRSSTNRRTDFENKSSLAMTGKKGTWLLKGSKRKKSGGMMISAITMKIKRRRMLAETGKGSSSRRSRKVPCKIAKRNTPSKMGNFHGTLNFSL